MLPRANLQAQRRASSSTTPEKVWVEKEVGSVRVAWNSGHLPMVSLLGRDEGMGCGATGTQDGLFRPSQNPEFQLCNVAYVSGASALSFNPTVLNRVCNCRCYQWRERCYWHQMGRGPRVLLNTLQCTGCLPQQKYICLKMSHLCYSQASWDWLCSLTKSAVLFTQFSACCAGNRGPGSPRGSVCTFTCRTPNGWEEGPP
jgi:hypothetical protein